MLNWLLIFVPVTAALHYLWPAQQTLTFLSACLAIVPLAGWMGRATEHVAERTGEGIGGLLNATFGNAAELIIAIMALRAGLMEVVKASITGSIIGNLLLVLGASILSGGIRFKAQQFNSTAARSQSTSLLLASIAVTVVVLVRARRGLRLAISLVLSALLVLLASFALDPALDGLQRIATGTEYAAKVRDIRRTQRLQDDLRIARAAAGMGQTAHSDDFLDAKGEIQARALRQHRQAPGALRPRPVAERTPIQAHPPGAGRQLAGQGGEQGALAGAVGPEHAEHLARLQLQVDAAEHGALAAADFQLFCPQHQLRPRTSR